VEALFKRILLVLRCYVHDKCAQVLPGNGILFHNAPTDWAVSDKVVTALFDHGYFFESGLLRDLYQHTALKKPMIKFLSFFGGICNSLRERLGSNTVV